MAKKKIGELSKEKTDNFIKAVDELINDATSLIAVMKYVEIFGSLQLGEISSDVLEEQVQKLSDAKDSDVLTPYCVELNLFLAEQLIFTEV